MSPNKETDSDSKRQNESLLCDRIQSLKNYINMRFLKGDFLEISADAHSNKNISNSYIYPNTDAAVTQDKIKSLSETTANKTDGDFGCKESQSKELRSYEQLTYCHPLTVTRDTLDTRPADSTSRKFGDEMTTEIKESLDHRKESDPALSPPLARQLFDRHELSDQDEASFSNEKHLYAEYPKWSEEKPNPYIQPTLKQIKEDSECSSNDSNDKENANTQNIKANAQNVWQNNSQPEKIKSENKNTHITFKIQLGNQNCSKSADKLTTTISEKDDRSQKLPLDVLTVEFDNKDNEELANSEYINEISKKLLEGLKDHFKSMADSSKTEQNNRTETKLQVDQKYKNLKNKLKSMDFEYNSSVPVRSKPINKHKFTWKDTQKVLKTSTSYSQLSRSNQNLLQQNTNERGISSRNVSKEKAVLKSPQLDDFPRNHTMSLDWTKKPNKLVKSDKEGVLLKQSRPTTYKRTGGWRKKQVTHKLKSARSPAIKLKSESRRGIKLKQDTKAFKKVELAAQKRLRNSKHKSKPLWLIFRVKLIKNRQIETP